jgi:superfamily II DNA/RNA helicase
VLEECLSRAGVRKRCRIGRSRSSEATEPTRERAKGREAVRERKKAYVIATDIASRGIDVEVLGSVVNFDVPHVAEDLSCLAPGRPGLNVLSAMT